MFQPMTCHYKSRNDYELEIWGKAQRESTQRRKSGGIHGGEIPPVAKSRGPNSNALAYAECPTST